MSLTFKDLPLELARKPSSQEYLYYLVAILCTIVPDTHHNHKERFAFLCGTHGRSLRSNSNLVLKTAHHISSFYDYLLLCKNCLALEFSSSL